MVPSNRLANTQLQTELQVNRLRRGGRSGRRLATAGLAGDGVVPQRQGQAVSTLVAGERKPLGAFYALPLFGGFALYLAGHLLFKRRMHNALSLPVHRPTASPTLPPTEPTSA